MVSFVCETGFQGLGRISTPTVGIPLFAPLGKDALCDRSEKKRRTGRKRLVEAESGGEVNTRDRSVEQFTRIIVF